MSELTNATICYALWDPLKKAVWSYSIRTRRSAAIDALVGKDRRKWRQFRGYGWRIIKVKVVPVARHRQAF